MPPLYPAPPPLVTARPSSPAARGGGGWKWFSLVLMLLVLLLAASHVSRWFLGGGGRGLARAQRPTALLEVLVEDHDSRHKIALVEVAGLIMGRLADGSGQSLAASIRHQLERATEDPQVKAVLLRVDSPGGEAMAADAIAEALRDFQAKSGKPVIASLGGLAASGGYYVSAPCRWIIAHELTLTGSIGVIMHGFNYRGLLEKLGMYPVVYKSGKFKDMLSGSRAKGEILPEEQQMAQAMIEQIFARFKSVIKEGRESARERNEGRGRPLSPQWEQYADGRILTGREAYEHGFVDELGDQETALRSAQRLAGIPDANLIRYQPPFDLAHVLRWFVQTRPLDLDLRAALKLPDLEAGRPYFLSPVLCP